MTNRQSNDPARRPFPAHPHVDRYFPGRFIEEARGRLGRAIERGDGPGLVIGASGTGKTLLLQVLAEAFRDQFDIAMLQCGQLCTRRALLQAILFELELPYRYHDEGELRLTLLDYLLRSERCPNGILLLVDEAQSLPVRLLEEIRLMSNLVRDGEPRVRLVLAGGPSMEELLARAELESFQQRIGTRCYLGPLSQSETSQYVRAHLAAAEMDPAATLDEAALNAVYDATDGIPRLINQLCGHVLLANCPHGQMPISREQVQTAWADLQQLPVPWETHPEVLASSPVETIIEFGELADEPDVDELDLPPVESYPQMDLPAQLWSDRSEASPGSAQEAPAAELEVLDPTVLDEDEDDVQPAPAASIEIGHDAKAHGSPVVASPQQPAVDRAAAPGDGPAAPQKARSDDQPPARDPFGESFEDEEVVFETFSMLGDALGVGVPRVAERTTGERMSAAVDRVLGVAARAEQESADAAPDDTPTAEEPLPLETISLVKGVTGGPMVGDDFCDPVYPEEELVLMEEASELATSVATIRYPGFDSEQDAGVLSIATARPEDESAIDESVVDSELEEEDILIVEESPAEEVPFEGGVHRQDYRQLFANLRRK